MGIVVGIDASRNRSGGAKVHLIGLLSAADPCIYGISQVHIWSYQSMLDALPNYSWLIKHHSPALERSLPSQVWWQYHVLPKEAKALGCHLMLHTFAGTIGRFRPHVVMSHNMLSFEKNERWRFGFSKATLRYCLLRQLKSFTLKRADAAIFLTAYAAKCIQNITGILPRSTIIPHGADLAFRRSGVHPNDLNDKEIRCVYVSNIALYKHQWHVVRAISALRKQGYPIKLSLIGEGKGPAQKRLTKVILDTDPTGVFIEQHGMEEHALLPQRLFTADIFIFASSCESMPNTLIEAMSAGIPIACSNRGPMPDILAEGGVYFDPETPSSIANAIEQIILDPSLRINLIKHAKAQAFNYSWERCARETWTYLQQTVMLQDNKI